MKRANWLLADWPGFGTDRSGIRTPHRASRPAARWPTGLPLVAPSRGDPVSCDTHSSIGSPEYGRDSDEDAVATGHDR
jgi:hypothetical protein